MEYKLALAHLKYYGINIYLFYVFEFLPTESLFITSTIGRALSCKNNSMIKYILIYFFRIVMQSCVEDGSLFYAVNSLPY